jgi:hypothetical protein
MSIQDEIKARCSQGRLFYLPPLFPSDRRGARELFVSKEVDLHSHPPWSESDDIYEGMRAVFDAYSSGQVVSLASHPRKKRKSAIFAPIEPKEDRVWDIRCVAPSPGVRVFGHFAYADCFIALSVLPRDQLDDPQKWRDARERCKAQWRQLFGTYQPLKGEQLSDYISENCQPA